MGSDGNGCSAKAEARAYPVRDEPVGLAWCVAMRHTGSMTAEPFGAKKERPPWGRSLKVPREVLWAVGKHRSLAE
jgi:hypothetical protein